uniref:Uncharacterized protein n=1 Tax=uncultured prokaryote TaxID=198431 RepID=A0A0H5Q311_9ZZZZ|nr:hypothetical protein [uncultured prokaryote]
MGRAERRRRERLERRAGLDDHADCSCVPRGVEALAPVLCPQCGTDSSAWFSNVVMPTMALPGEVKEMFAGCNCGAEYVVPVLITPVEWS